MSLAVRKALTQLIFPGLTIVLVVVVSAISNLSPAEDLRVVRPSWSQMALWLPVWVLWMGMAEWLSARLDVHRSPGWELRDRAALAVRVLTRGVVAPVAEELLFRGLLFEQFASTALGPVGAVVVSASVFALVHIQYGPKQGVFIFLDGLVFGVARLASGSVVLPMLMHVIGNLIAISQRVWAGRSYP